MYPRAVNADSRLDRTMSYRRKGWKVTQMSKGEFLDTLRSKLTGEIPPGKVRENIDYYSQYINDKVRTGIAEQDVIQMLGDPLLIARTIIDTQGCSEANDSGTAYSYETDPQESRGNENLADRGNRISDPGSAVQHSAGFDSDYTADCVNWLCDFIFFKKTVVKRGLSVRRSLFENSDFSCFVINTKRNSR